jgi:hypothetical protein
MANLDVTVDGNLTNMTSIAATDRLLLVDAGTSALQDLEVSVLSTYIAGTISSNGWNADANTWTYASASTFTISGDYTAIYTKGTRIKWTQTTVKYGTVVSSSYGAPNTTVTILVNTNYVVTNAAISANYYSYLAAPLSFPQWFTYTSTGTNITLGNGTIVAKYMTVGKTLWVTILFTLGSTSAVTGDVNFTLPIAVVAEGTGKCSLADTGTARYDGDTQPSGTALYVRTKGSSGTYVTSGVILSSTVPHTWATTDFISLSLWYEW